VGIRIYFCFYPFQFLTHSPQKPPRKKTSTLLCWRLVDQQPVNETNEADHHIPRSTASETRRPSSRSALPRRH
jgi:hypothetical protein